MALDTPDVRTGLYRLSHGPVRFGERYRPELEASTSCTVVLDATVVALEATPDRRHVRRVVAVGGSSTVSVDASVVVLATGAIDVARLLLLTGLANSSGLVGTGFMEHPHIRIGRVALADRWQRSLQRSQGGVGYEAEQGWPHLSPTATALTERGLLNAAIAMDSWESSRPITDVDVGVAALTGVRSRMDHSAMTMRVEQAAVPSNRVELGAARDRLGLRVARLVWRVDPATMESARSVARLVATAMGAAGVGRLQVDMRMPALVGPHHMGTARMSDDPTAGVVDRDCRSHDVDNLYIASSATFPTSGHANPTLTIVAMAHRLGDHLARLVTGRPAPPLPTPPPVPPPATAGP